MTTHDAARAGQAIDRPPALDRVAASLRRMQLAFRRWLRHLRQAPPAARAARRRAGGSGGIR